MLRALIPALLLAPITVHAASPAPATPSPAFAPARGLPSPDRVEIRTEDDLSLRGTYFAPGGKSKQLAPAALIVHRANGDRSELVKVAERLQRQGFGVLTFDLRGHGESRTDDLDWSQLDDEGRAAQWALAIRDVDAAARWLLKQDGIHSTNLSMIGVGAGSALAVRHAIRDENVRCVALLSPSSREFGFDVESDLRELGGLPTLVLTPRKGTEDTVRMVEAANGVSSPYIELEFTATKATSVLADRKTPITVAKWVQSVAVPKKGRG